MALSRRQFLAALPSPVCARAAGTGHIGRRALVQRHNPVLTSLDPQSPLSVGNGEFAFTADVTGLQTFPEVYERKMPLCTMAQWGWHTAPNPTGQTIRDFRLTLYDTHGREVGYPTSSQGQKPLYDWLRENPHKFHLGRIGFLMEQPESVGGIFQILDLWSGILHSEFTYQAQRLVVETCCHPHLDALAVTVRGKVPVCFEFPYGSPAMSAADWNSPAKHKTEVIMDFPNRIDLRRELDGEQYTVSIAWQGNGQIQRAGPHRFVLDPGGASLAFVCGFRQRELPPVSKVFAASGEGWSRFWTKGAAVSFEGSTDRRARELERRVVLSQYQTAIQCAGSLPPQETGLTCNSWSGQFHLEMHFWHAAHFPVWGRAALLERSLPWYAAILPAARQTARGQGYAGVRWPKMSIPDGRNNPSPIAPLLIWQQPHPIAMAELCYRAHPDRATLDRYREVVFESAEFMASFAWFDARGQRYVLGPPVIPAQENHPPRETWNPTFELEYWADALETGQQWRERLGMPRDPKWEDVRTRLSALPVGGGVYLAHENCPQTFTERNRDHPSMLAALGVLPGAKVDRDTMRRTLAKVIQVWKWPDTWGWDFPMVAMTAAALGQPATAVDVLMMDTPKNTWLPNGHNWQRDNLPLYLPGNGALLLAVAKMVNLRAFPAGGWTVRGEGFTGLA
jgi:hypothetical protein